MGEHGLRIYWMCVTHLWKPTEHCNLFEPCGPSVCRISLSASTTLLALGVTEHHGAEQGIEKEPHWSPPAVLGALSLQGVRQEMGVSHTTYVLQVARHGFAYAVVLEYSDDLSITSTTAKLFQ